MDLHYDASHMGTHLPLQLGLISIHATSCAKGQAQQIRATEAHATPHPNSQCRMWCDRAIYMVRQAVVFFRFGSLLWYARETTKPARMKHRQTPCRVVFTPRRTIHNRFVARGKRCELVNDVTACATVTKLPAATTSHKPILRRTTCKEVGAF